MKSKKGNRQKGVAAIEMALMLPILLLLVLGICDWSLLMFRQQVLTNAVREGARQGIVLGNPRPTTADIINVINTYLTDAGLDPGNAGVNVTGAGGATGTNLNVQLNFPYEFIVLDHLPGVNAITNLNAASTMILE
jgi:Flp pilus assembly protein TadG